MIIERLGLARVVAIVAVTAACGGHTSTTPTPPVTNEPVRVSGHLMEAATSAPIPFLGLTFGTQRATTDAAGRYEVSVPVGDYAVQADGEPTPETILVRGTWTSGDLLVRKIACGVRYGDVTDAATGRPVTGATVRVSDSVATDATGWYRLNGGCSCGTCNTAVVTVNAPGYQPFSTGVGRGFTDIRRLDVALVRQAVSPLLKLTADERAELELVGPPSRRP